MRKLIVFISFFLFLQTNAFSQPEKDFCIGKNVSIESELLGKSEEIQVYLPKSYSVENNKKYPILYLLDGNQYFHTVTGVVNQLVKAKKIPETIVIGINPDRKYCFDNELLKEYLEFIEKELQPFVINNYNSTPYNILVANSIYGQIGLYAFINKSNFFQSIILSSSFFTFTNYLFDFQLFLNQQNKLQNNLYISSGFEEENKIDKIYKLARVLSWTPIEGLNWEYKQFEKEDREMVLLLSVIEYLPQIFSDIQISPFPSYKDFKEKFENKEILFNKYKYDFLDMSSSPMSVSQPLLDMILNGKQLSKIDISHFEESPYYFSDNVELFNLSSYLSSVGRLKESKQILKLIEGDFDHEFTNNYTSSIDLTRGLIFDLALDTINIASIISNNGEAKYFETTSGINNIPNSAVKLTHREGKISLKYNSNIDPRKSITVSCWICPNQLRPADSWAISMKKGNNGPHWNTTVGMYPDQWGLEIYSISRFMYLVRDTIPLNKWTHIVFVADQSIGRLTIYKNGENIYETNDLVPFYNSTETLQIGNDIFSFDGKLDEFKLYQRALNPEEAKQLYLEKQ